MSQISQKSISGITSITTPAGIDNQFTLHTNDTSQAAKLDAAGNFHFSNHVNTTGITSASNFKTGSSDLHSTGLTVGNTLVHSTGVNASSMDIDDFVDVGNNIKLGNAGVITATSFVGDGSDLTNLPAGLGTALSATATSPLNKMYYTNQVLGVPSSITVDVPASASKAYTQYADIKVESSADLIVAEGDDLIPDVLGLADFGTFGGGASAGRIRVNSISNAANDGSPTVQKGLVVTGVTTSTTFSGSGASLTNLPAANITGTLPAISGANLTNLPAANITGTLPAISGANLTGVLKNLVEDTSPQLGGNLIANTHNMQFGDSGSSSSNRLQFGSSQDLEIFHDGNQSIVRDSGTGNLMLQSNQVTMESADGGETMAKFIDDGAVQLYWNNAIKLYTNANGINVDKCLQAGSVQTPIESSITHHQSHDPAAIFYPEGAYGNNNSPSNQRQAVIIGSTKGNWVDGHTGNTRGVGIKFSRIVNSAEQIRAGIQHDINNTEKFKFHTSYGDIHFRTRNGNNGNQTWEECDRDPLVMHHNGHVSMCHMPRTLWQVQQSSSSYSGNTTEYTYTGGSATDSNGMSTNTGNGTVTVPYTGVYHICLNIGLHSNNATNQRLNLKINGSNFQRTESTETGWCTHTITHCILLQANDQLSFTCVGRTDGSYYSKMSVVMLHGTLTT